MTLKPPSIRRRKYKEKGDGGDVDCSDNLSSSQIVEEAQRENMLHRGLSDLLMGCCTGLEVDVVADESVDAFDVSRELEELEKEISLAKEMKETKQMDSETDTDASSDKKESLGTSVGRNTPTSPPGERPGAMRAISSAASSSTSSSGSLLSSSASWTESVESNIKFLVGSCSSRQVQVDSMPETAFEV